MTLVLLGSFSPFLELEGDFFLEDLYLDELFGLEGVILMFSSFFFLLTLPELPLPPELAFSLLILASTGVSIFLVLS
jgi:hypothetical protein